MNSPFPGMDPYLEGYLWTDVHQALANEIRRQIAPLIRPYYAARLVSTLWRKTLSTDEFEFFLPDIAPQTYWEQFQGQTSLDEMADIADLNEPIPSPIMIPLLDFEARITNVEIYDVAKHQLITSIEILSPVNKREPGLTQYREKQQQLREAGIHLLEIDLLRRGQRRLHSPFTHFQKLLDNIHYLVTLIRAGAKSCGIWPIRLQDALPVVPVPLRAPDPDVELNLSEAFKNIYEEAGYDLSIDYSADPPPPTLDEYDAQWVQRLLASRSSNIS